MEGSDETSADDEDGDDNNGEEEQIELTALQQEVLSCIVQLERDARQPPSTSRAIGVLIPDIIGCRKWGHVSPDEMECVVLFYSLCLYLGHPCTRSARDYG